MWLLSWIIREKQLTHEHLATDLVPNVEPYPCTTCLSHPNTVGVITMLPHAQLIFCLRSAHTSLRLRHRGAE